MSWYDGIGGSVVSALAQLGLGMYNTSSNKKESRKADERALLNALYLYNYQQSEGPSLTRKGLEKAGYNPMLALSGINTGSASMASTHAANQHISLDTESAFRAGKALQKLTLDTAEAEKDNIEADTALKEGQLGVFDAQKAKAEAEIAMLHSQTDRSDLAYGRDIANTIIDIAGTGASMYSAKAMSDVAKANAAANALNATTNARKLDQHTTETHYDNNGKKTGSTERTTFSNGEPLERNSANPNSKPNATGKLGGSAKDAIRNARDIAIVLGGGYLAAESLMPWMERWYNSDEDDIKQHNRKSPIQYKEKKGRSNFVPRFGM